MSFYRFHYVPAVFYLSHMVFKNKLSYIYVSRVVYNQFLEALSNFWFYKILSYAATIMESKVSPQSFTLFSLLTVNLIVNTLQEEEEADTYKIEWSPISILLFH